MPRKQEQAPLHTIAITLSESKQRASNENMQLSCCMDFFTVSTRTSSNEIAGTKTTTHFLRNLHLMIFLVRRASNRFDFTPWYKEHSCFLVLSEQRVLELLVRDALTVKEVTDA